MLVVMPNILRHAPITRGISVAVSVIGLLVAFVLLPVHAAEQYRGQVRIPGHMGVLRRPLDERQKYVKFGYMESYDRDGVSCSVLSIPNAIF